MAKIVMVHGAGNELWGPASVAARWAPALADGLAWHGIRIDPDDVAIAFYGDLFREDPEAGYVPPVDPKQAVATVAELVHGVDPHVDLAELTSLLTERHLDRLLAEVQAYFEHDEIRSGARARVAGAITDETRVVVAHSLGTIVAYEVLCADRRQVTDLVTIGSPLAGDVVFAHLDPAPRDGVGVWPAGLLAWTNVLDPDDPACRGGFHGRFTDACVQLRIDNGHRLHDPEPYLNNPATGGAVAAGLTRRS
jgi:hypothetical protein